MKKCKTCNGPEFPMWFSTDYCSRSCAIYKAKELAKQYREVISLLRERK